MMNITDDTSGAATRRSAFAAPALVAMAILGAGCATTGTTAQVTPRTPEPSAWHASALGVEAAPAGDLARWWDTLGDAILSSLVDRAIEGNLDLRSAQVRLRQARAERALAQASRMPSVTASGGASSTKRDGVEATGSLTASLDASWEPDVFGGRRYEVEAAQADLLSTEEDLHSVQVTLTAEVALNYGDWRTSQLRLEIARRNEASQAETLQLTMWRMQAGLTSGVDVEQARANLEQTRAQIPAIETSAAQAAHRLAVLLGREPSALFAELDGPGVLPSPPDHVAVSIPADTLRQRPDVRAAEQRVVAETARVARVKTTRYPSFSLGGSLGTEWLTGALTGGASTAVSMAGKVFQTIFDGGRIRQQIAIQTTVQEQAVISYEAVVLTALEEVENALVSYESTRQRLEALEAAETAARAAARLARSQYTAGLVDFQTVLDTERTVLSAEDGLATTRGDRLSALIRLYKALGGGWPAPSAVDSAATQAKSS